jgi:hypothetical protein
MKAITMWEARYAILTTLIAEVTLYDRADEDVYHQFKDNYVLDKSRLVPVENEGMIYFPTENDIKVFQKEAEKIYRVLSRMKNECRHKYKTTTT